MSAVLAVLSSTVLAVAGVLAIGRETTVAGVDAALVGSAAIVLAVMIGATTVLLWAARGPGAVNDPAAAVRRPHRARSRS